MPHISLIAEAIDRLGGVAAAARALGRRRVTVERWLSGAVPPAEVVCLLEVAGALSVADMLAHYRTAAVGGADAMQWARAADQLVEARAIFAMIGGRHA